MPRKPQPAPFDGALIVNKPRGKTSHDVVEAVRRLAHFRQIGHLGTLDPLATGVLGLLLGRATRLAQFYTGRRKRYACVFRFGFATDTYDADGKPAGEDTAPVLSRGDLEAMAAEFTGRISQIPPPYSAKKIHGRPAHELARKNKPVTLAPVEVDVFEFRILDVEGPRMRCEIECGAGTYIRSLAHDLGAKHGAGAHLEEIARTAVGEFTLDQALGMEEIEEASRRGALAELIIPLERMLPELPRATVLPIVERRVRHGAKFTVTLAQIQPGHVVAAPGATAQLDSGEWKPARLRVFSQQQKLIAVAEAVVPRTYQPIVVLDAAP
jgi:tRNA pseudouridine55 synthase